MLKFLVDLDGCELDIVRPVAGSWPNRTTGGAAPQVAVGSGDRSGSLYWGKYKQCSSLIRAGCSASWQQLLIRLRVVEMPPKRMPMKANQLHQGMLSTKLYFRNHFRLVS